MPVEIAMLEGPEDGPRIGRDCGHLPHDIAYELRAGQCGPRIVDAFRGGDLLRMYSCPDAESGPAFTTAPPQWSSVPDPDEGLIHQDRGPENSGALSVTALYYPRENRLTATGIAPCGPILDLVLERIRSSDIAARMRDLFGTRQTSDVLREYMMDYTMNAFESVAEGSRDPVDIGVVLTVVQASRERFMVDAPSDADDELLMDIASLREEMWSLFRRIMTVVPWRRPGVLLFNDGETVHSALPQYNAFRGATKGAMIYHASLLHPRS